MNNKDRNELDRIIKDFIGDIRRTRDILYRQGLLPINAIVETVSYKPVLWKRRGR